MPADTSLSAGRLRVSGGQGRGQRAALLSAALHLALAGLGLGIWETRSRAPAAPLMAIELVMPDSPAPAPPPEPPPAAQEPLPEKRQVVTPPAPAKVARPQARPRTMPNPTPPPTPVVPPVEAVAEAVTVQSAPAAVVAEETYVIEKITSSAIAAADAEMAQYALAVRLALGRAARNHAGPKGRVDIAFGLDAQGGVRTGSIARSSGRPELDASALALVRATAFPLPPANSTDAQRSYVIPIEFR